MFVYLLQAGEGGPVKIGFSAKVGDRVRSLSTGIYEAMRVLRVIEGGRETESWLHDRFAAERRRGEWFNFHPDMLTVLPPDPDTLRVDQLARSGALEELLTEVRRYIVQITADLPITATIKERQEIAAERFGITFRRVKGFWHMEARSVSAEEADRMRRVVRAHMSEHADKLEREARVVRQELGTCVATVRRHTKPERQTDLLTLLESGSP